MKIRQSSTLLSGLFFTALGAATIGLSYQYSMGSAGRMGPGYFPMLTAIVLTSLGGALIATSFARHDGAVGTVRLRPVSCIVSAIVAFGFLIEHGLILATMSSIIIASVARPVKSASEVLFLAVSLSAFSALVFVYGLGLPMKLLPF